jgi:hypothetical protein
VRVVVVRVVVRVILRAVRVDVGDDAKLTRA